MDSPTVGGYDVLQLLGRGACGEVLLVRGPGGQPAAMKVIPCDPNESRTSAAFRNQEAALAEAELLKGLRHPHIVACHEVMLDAKRHTVRLLLEYMDGGDLQGLIENQRSVAKEAFGTHFERRVLAAVGSALAFIHCKGVLHRDVKPANVLLSKRSQRIKLADFGIAKLVEEATLRAQTVVGTPFYFSPEIVSGEAYGPASDSWALGACLYEVAALHRPFEASNQLALVLLICEKSPPPLPEDTSSDVQAAVDGLLVKDQRQRMTLAKALAVSAAVAALVVSDSESVEGEGTERLRAVDGEGTESANEGDAADEEPLAASPDTAAASGDSWRDAERIATPPPPTEGLAAARAALGAEVDDPEDLCMALEALEGAEDDAALDSLRQELKVRLGALREDANEQVASLLSELLSESSSPSKPSQAESTLLPGGLPSMPGSQVSTPRGADAAEEAIEQATTLGVDTEPVEEHLAHVRRMLSVRIVWGGALRFCLLPLRCGYSALLREVLSRFSLRAPVQLCWREGSDTFPLDGEASWQDCLQRRGLTERPGRLEIEVLDGSPPHRRSAPRSAKAAPAAPPQQLQPSPSDVGLFVTGSKAFRGRAKAAVATGRPSSRKQRTKQTDYRTNGKAWAVAPGREQRVHWAGAPTTAMSQTAASKSGGQELPAPDVGLCLDVRAATIKR